MKQYHSKIVGDDGDTHAEIWWDTDKNKLDGTNLHLIRQLVHINGVDMNSAEYARLVPHAYKPHTWFHLHTVSKDDWK